MASLPRLGIERLGALRRARHGVVAVPDASLLDLPERAVQFGTGAFLRGFVDDFLHRANEQGLFGGRVVAIGSTGSTRDGALRAQDGLYTLAVEGIERGQPVQETRIVSSLSRALSAVDDWPAVLAVARAPMLQFVFSNTTEVGIATHPDDRADDAPPRSYPAKLTRFLFERAREFAFDPEYAPIVLPCELIENNGDRLRELVLQLVERWSLDTRFREWLDAVTFCNTLVDRIVPGAPRADDARRFADVLGYDDALITTCEPYRLFAIQGDDRLRERLGWSAADIAIVIAADVTPFRERKVRLLNGAHTILVSAALGLGCETVREAVMHPALGRFVRQAMFDEIVPTLDVDDAAEFAEAVLDRFRNPFIRHALVDITLQATMKMRVRVIPSIVAYTQRAGQVPASLAFGFAMFLLYQEQRARAADTSAGSRLPADDQGAPLLALWQRVTGGPAATMNDFVDAVCRDTTLWGTDLTALPGFAAVVSEHLTRARLHGVAVALEHHLGTLVT
jgi:tagaturonate reductase